MENAAALSERADRLSGLLLGTAVGDALGLPREGLSRRRAARIYGAGPLTHRFVLGRGMLSDDTEHACMTAQALLAAPADERRFARSLAWRLRGWLLAMPAAVGWGTLRAIVKLWLGFSPQRSGVRSAGNGAAMRAPILGACLARTGRVEAVVRASTRLTHTDPRAEEGALVVAVAAAHAMRALPGTLDAVAVLDEVGRLSLTDEMKRRLGCVRECLDRGDSHDDFARSLGLERGVSGFILDTVPAALFCWLASPYDFRRSVERVIVLGGDADSTGAIVGALSGLTVGASRIPEEWLAGIVEWPRTMPWIQSLGERLARQFYGGERAPGPGPLRLFWPALPARNMVFLAVALAHGLRRLLPPY